MNSKKNKYIVGITGGIGCGKTTVTDMFKAKGIEVIDADIVARNVVVPGSAGLQQLVAYFGHKILTPLGELDRAQLREIVFNNQQAKQKLNQILHPLIRQNMLHELQNTQSQYCILSAPLLFENKLQTLVNRSVVVDVTQSQQLSRTMARDGGKQETVENIIKAQLSRNERLTLADDIIDNSQGIEQLNPQINQLHQQFLTLSSQVIKQVK